MPQWAEPQRHTVAGSCVYLFVCLFAYGNIVGDKLKVESICTTAVVFLSVSLLGTQTALVLACG